VIRYFDAGALAKRYVAETYSEAVADLLSEGTAVTGRLSEAELASAFARRHREGSLTLRERDRLLDAMLQDMDSLYVVEISPEVSRSASRLLMRHRLRARDALHLASAVALAAQAKATVQFVAFDTALNKAAEREGLDLAVWPR
jgi:predicted nucleic acid-binding protein